MPFNHGTDGNDYPTPHWPSIFAGLVCAAIIFFLFWGGTYLATLIK